MSQTLAVANGDLDINALGTCDLIQGRDKVSQDIAEILLSDYDAERDYGGKLQTMSVTGAGAKALVSSELQGIMKRLQAMQSNDPNITSQERIASVPNIIVNKITDTDFTFQIDVRTVDRGTLSMVDTVRFRNVKLAHTWPGGVNPFTEQ